MRYQCVASNPLQTRDDVARALVDLWRPVRDRLSAEGAAVSLGEHLAHYGRRVQCLETFARPLWGLVPWAAGDGHCADWPLIRNVLATGVNPASDQYWGAGNDYDQRYVEAAAIAVAILLARQHVWDPLDNAARENLVAWLSTINERRLRDNNWLFFRLMVNAAFRALGLSAAKTMDADIRRLDGFYRGDGWYTDGATTQRDYYIPMAFHFYSLLLCGTRTIEDEWSSRFRERAAQFAEQFLDWFAADGSSFPYGRSLTYRFAHGAFWGALAFANVKALPWGVAKGVYLRQLRWWAARPVFTDQGLLSIGYTYPNLIMAEDYNAPGSPYWAFKAFLPLALPATHPFWSEPEQALPVRPRLVAQPRAGLLISHNESGSHVWALSNNQVRSGFRHGAQKYSKFVYSNVFGFCVPVGGLGPRDGAGDSALILSDDGLDWRTRIRLDDARPVAQGLFSRWRPWGDVVVETWLAAWQDGHLRVHYIDTRRDLVSFEGAYAVGYSGPDDLHATARGEDAAVNSSSAFSAMRGLLGRREGITVRNPGNSNIVNPLTASPGLAGRHRRCSRFWLVCACLGQPGEYQASQVDGYFGQFSLAWVDGTLRVQAGKALVVSCCPAPSPGGLRHLWKRVSRAVLSRINP
jgi:hypothetical protein